MKVLSRARAVGGSIMVTIPKEMVVEEGIKEGQLLEVEVSKARKSYFGFARGIGSMTREDRLDSHD